MSGNFGSQREKAPALYHADGAVQPLDRDTCCNRMALDAADAALWALRVVGPPN